MDNDIRGDKEGFRGLWKRIKPVEKPDEVRGFSLVIISLTNSIGGIQGVPFDTHDSMFNPPTSRVSPYGHDSDLLPGQEVSPSPNPVARLVCCFLTLLLALDLNRNRNLVVNLDHPKLVKASSL